MSPLLVAVLPIVLSPDARIGPSEIFKAVSDAAALRPSLNLLSLDQYFFQEGGELANRALACGADTTCIASQLAPFKAKLGVVVIANLEIDPPLLSILLLDTERRTTIGESTGEVGAELQRAISDRTSALFDRAGHPRSGRLVVQVSPAQAVVSIVGQTSDLDARGFTLSPGSYTIVASSDGYEASSATTVVKSGETTEVSIALVEESSIFESPWFWIVSSAVVVAAGATAIGFALTNTERCVCVQTADGRDCSVCN
jgi:hypothetical protein